MSSSQGHDPHRDRPHDHRSHKELGPTDDASVPKHHPPIQPPSSSWLVAWVISGIVLLIGLLWAIVAFVLLRKDGEPPL